MIPTNATHYYPAFLDLRGRRVVVLGGGAPAAQKVADLVGTGAEITVIAPEADPLIEHLAAEGAVTWQPRAYQETDCRDAFLLFAAGESRAVNERAARDARRSGVLVNALDDPANCSFIAPATVRRGGLTLAVSTGGRSPAFARFLRRQLEAAVGDEYAVLLAIVADVRREIRGRGRRPSRDRWQLALAEAFAAYRAGEDRGQVRERLIRALSPVDPAWPDARPVEALPARAR